jgi:Zn finger protein HypA/HybF (possibly regulating hydrogenase expression)
MHEAAIASRILEKSLKMAWRKILETNDQGDSRSSSCFRIGSVTVRVGEFRNVESESLRFAFDALRKENAMTESAALEIEEVSASAFCKSGHNYHPEMDSYYCCPACGSGIESISEGKELEIICVQLEELQGMNQIVAEVT